MNHETIMDKDYDILSLFGKEELETIQKRLSNVTQLAFVTVNYRGEPLTDFTSFCSFCSHYRNDPVLHKNCEVSDAISSIQSSIIKKPNIYECPCGLMEIAIPIVVNDIYLGGFLCGQATCSNPPEDLIRVKASINNQDFREALKTTKEFKKELPCFTYERFEDIASLVSLVIEMLCESKINQINEEKNIANKVEIIKKLEVARVQLRYPIMKDVFVYINQHIEEEITLSSIVDICSISQGYLSKIFRVHFGISVTDYIHIRKICIAKDLLSSTSMSVGDISFQLNYNEPTYFSKIFKKYTGQTIQTYKKEMKKL